MRVVRQDNSPTNIILTISGDAADLEPIKNHVLSHFKHSVKVPGFREGKAPLGMIEKYANQQRLLDEFMEHALNELYRRAIDEQQIRPLSTPNVQLKKFVPYSQLEFEAETEILGPIKLPNYKALKLAKKPISVSAKEVDEVVKSLQVRLAQRVIADRPAKLGDELVIDFEGRDKSGKKISGAAGKDYPLLLGSQAFIPGFEEKLVGAKAGDTRQFEISFPEDYGVASLQAKKVDFLVSINKVSQLKLPKADDDMAAQAGPFKTFLELKADIKKQLSQEKVNQAETEYQNELISKIADKTEIDIPSSLIEEEISRLEAQEKQNLSYRGQTWQEHLQAEGISEQQHRDRQRPEAMERAKAGLILSEVARAEGITVTPEETEIRLQILKGQYQDPQMQAELDKPENRRDIEARLLTEKTLAKLSNYARK